MTPFSFTAILLPLLAAALTISPPARAILHPLDSEALEQWWIDHPTPRDWQQAIPEIDASLLETYREQGQEAFRDGTPFRQWWTHLQWLLTHDPALQSSGMLQGFRELGQQPEITAAFLQALHPEDNREKALEILLSLYLARQDAFPEYTELAVAFAIVFDQPFPQNWPHHQVPRQRVPFGDEQVLTRFDFYVQLDDDRDTEYDLDGELPARLLKFMVDSTIRLDEFRWVQEELDFDLDDLENAFSFISYDTPRMLDGQMVWPYPSYRLRDILENTGICVDQAYFATMVGKALGVPTLYFSGQGAGGGHAWFGYLEDDDQWRTDIGKYASQNYPVGNALDPQTWQPINDASLTILSEGWEEEPNWEPVRQAYRFAQRHPDQPEYPQILEDCLELMPLNIQPWRARAQWLEQQGQTETLKTHLQAWIEQFDDHSDFKIEAQRQLLTLYQAENHPQARELQDDMVRENRKKRFDLGIASGVGPILDHLDQGSWEKAQEEYKRLVRRFDDQGGGNLFYQVVRPYVLICLDEEKWEFAKEGLDYAERKMEFSESSILAREFADLTKLLETAETEL